MVKVTSKENFAKLIAYLREHGYSKGYIRKMETEMRVVVRMQENNEWTSYYDHYLHYAETFSSSSYLRCKRSIVGLLEQFDVRGVYPSGPSVYSSFMRESNYDHLPEEFKYVIDVYRSVEMKRGVKAPTIYVSSLVTVKK